MTPFLKQIASLFYREYGAKIARLAFVFPSRRAGLFFRKYLTEISDRPFFSPTILTISDLFMQMNGKQQADRTHMLFSLYNLYIKTSGSDETFDNFLYWGEMLLNDFDDVDKYMADARMLFSNVTDLRSIEQDFGFLSENQVAAIRTFWSAFYPLNDKPNKSEFLAVWELLYHLYVSLKQQLSEEGMGYEGMLFREVVDTLKTDEEVSLPYEKVVFIGLNALSKVEEELLKQLQKRGLADFYWDYDYSKVKDPQNRASYFIEQNLRQFPSAWDLPKEEETDPVIEVIGIPSGIGQAKHVYSILENLLDEGKLTEANSLNTAIVLPDETLLMPLLNSIPDAISQINVTMGYPLSGTPVAVLIDYIVALQKNMKYIDGQAAFYFRDVLPILNHRYLLGEPGGNARSIARSIISYNRIFISASELAETKLLQAIFRPVEDVDDFFSYLICLLKAFDSILGLQQAEDAEDAEKVNDITIHEIEQEYIFHYHSVVSRLKDVIAGSHISMTIDTCFRLIKRTIETITIPFEGEPLSGLQVMGVLETRALDFDRVIILSVNEGVFPSSSISGSFIPYNLRRGFGLPTYEHQDSIWSYYFYRLLYRAEHVSLLYDSRSGGLLSGEVSRFVHQLKYHYELPLEDKLIIYNVSSSDQNTLSIAKNKAVMQKLSAYYEGGEKSISASAVNIYLDCPLKFYFTVVEGIQEEETVSEMIESDVFGSILHKVMEVLYAPLCGKLVTADLLTLIRKDKTKITETIRKSFASVFFKKEDVRALTGQHYLIGEMIRKYVLKVLEQDSKLTPFYYLTSEQKMKDTASLPDGRVISLKGFIDRVDQVEDAVRIVDYKSGSGTTVFNSVESLFEKDSKDRPKAIMQVFMYAWMYSRMPENQGKQMYISPEIYFMRTLFSSNYDSGIYQKVDRGVQNPVKDFLLFKDDFEENFRSCLEEIFNPDVPFTQTTVKKNCSYCPLRKICGT